jgi:hypothetical protein
MSAPAQKPRKGSRVTLAWSVQGADSITLSRLPGIGTAANKWDLLPHQQEQQVEIERETTFELRAWDEAGYEDRKTITVQVEE